jgi:hypothetical protein
MKKLQKACKVSYAGSCAGVDGSLLGSLGSGIDEHPRNAYEDSSVCGVVITGDAEVEIRLGVSIQPYLLAAKGSSGEGGLCNGRAAYQDGRIDRSLCSQLW